MKRMKVLILAMSLVAAVAMAAETNVTSVNVVGYIKLQVEASKYYLVGIQFDSMTAINPTVNDIFGSNSVPDGTQVLLYNGAGYDYEQYVDTIGWMPGTNVIDRSVGFWFKSPVTTNFVLKGEVPAGGTPMVIASGYQLMTYPYPVAMPLTNTVLSTKVSDGDQILIFNGAGYDYEQYVDTIGWMPGTSVLQPGQGFWFKKIGTTNFTETVPYSL